MKHQTRAALVAQLTDTQIQDRLGAYAALAGELIAEWTDRKALTTKETLSMRAEVAAHMAAAARRGPSTNSEDYERTAMEMLAEISEHAYNMKEKAQQAAAAGQTDDPMTTIEYWGYVALNTGVASMSCIEAMNLETASPRFGIFTR